MLVAPLVSAVAVVVDAVRVVRVVRAEAEAAHNRAQRTELRSHGGWISGFGPSFLWSVQAMGAGTADSVGDGVLKRARSAAASEAIA